MGRRSVGGPGESRCQDAGVLGVFVLVIVVLLWALVAGPMATLSITTAISIAPESAARSHSAAEWVSAGRGAAIGPSRRPCALACWRSP
jgi:Ca2+/H+ antiporter